MVSWYLILFLVMGFLGVVLESILGSIEVGRVSFRGSKLFGGFPFLSMYAIGGLLMYLTMENLWGRPTWFVILMTTLLVNIWEYLGGIFCLKFFKMRLWDYRKQPGSIGGHISLYSAIWWLFLISLFYFFAFEELARLKMLF